MLCIAAMRGAVSSAPEAGKRTAAVVRGLGLKGLGLKIVDDSAAPGGHARPLGAGGRPGLRSWRFALAAAGGMLLMGASGAGAQESLGGGMTAPQLFSSNCSACHRSPQGLAKGRSAQALAGFLRRHYTTGPNPAATLAAYLAAAGDGPPGRATASRPATTPQQQRQPAAQQQQRQAAVPPAQQAAPQRQPGPAGQPSAGSPPASAAPTGRPAQTQTPQRRERLQGEVASVSSDPDPVVVSRQPVPLVHQRATSQAQDARQQARETADEEARRQRAAQAASAPVEAPAAAAPAPTEAGTAASPEPAAAEAVDDKASEAFSAPLP